MGSGLGSRAAVAVCPDTSTRLSSLEAQKKMNASMLGPLRLEDAARRVILLACVCVKVGAQERVLGERALGWRADSTWTHTLRTPLFSESLPACIFCSSFLIYTNTIYITPTKGAIQLYT